MFRFQRVSIFFLAFCVFPIVAVGTEPEEIHDPFEGWNRGVFWFNNQADRYILEPVAKGYDFVMPELAQDGVRNVFDNLKYPAYFVSDVVQLKFGQAANHTGRFLINSTVGLVGILDVAKHFGLEKHQEDFGTALAYHGVPAGPYFMLPFLGPTTFRDGMGSLVDRFLDPVYWIAYESMDDNDGLILGLGVTALDVVQTRADLLDPIEAAREAAVDYYLFVQSAYYQNRHAVIHDLRTSESDPFADEDPFDDEFDEDFEEDLSEE